MARMKNTRKNTRKNMRKNTRKNNMKRGGGYTMPYGYYNAPGFPTLVNPFAPVVSTNATSSMIRPELGQRGGSKKLKGGFSPSVMGGFIPNAQAAIVPLALYTVYHTLVPKKTRKNK
jgi:hypothetical protein